MSSSLSLQKSIAGSDALDVANLYSVDGRVAVVTGGGTGLGLVTATALAENGCTVYITGRRLEPLEEAAKFKPRKGNGRIVAIQADLGSKESIVALRDAVSAQEKFINVLVNNAGVCLSAPKIDNVPQTAEGLSKCLLEEDSFGTWGSEYDTHVTAVHFMTAAFLPLLAAATDHGFPEPGNIVNIASLSGITRTSQRGQFNYNASKAATIHLSLMHATEFSRRGLGIRVNAISPGYFPSGMSVADFGDRQSDDEHWREKYGIPLKRVGNAIDYAQCIIALIVNQYMTGSNVIIDGAWLAGMAF
ncbi:uncharacterized protein EHS24_001219 [Apiotrichum porosum]|uniref:Uncharacterized protein n=1 Tax=Apiotrichum porosum TaxID=105984 RepID=A0A427XJY6_9TREE|nr:uncharacterized protein EHS24_001219 [Apiotrichum porosum]RSH79180.1 hypothetical protein EHS24_001219 [Apiotrichum porosum]